MADPVKTEEPKYVSPSDRDLDALAEALEKEGLITPKEGAKTEPVSAEAKPEEKKVEPPFEPALVKKARENAEKRRAEAQNAPVAFKHIAGARAEAMERAIAAGDAVGLLAASGMTHAQYSAQLLGQKPPEGEKAETTESPDVKSLRDELNQIKAQHEAERAESTRAQARAMISARVKAGGERFRLINALDPEGASVERVILAYLQENGSPPGATFEETIDLAAELAENEFKKESEKWSKVLTPAQATAQTPVQKAPESRPSTGAEPPRTLTNGNSTQPGPAARSQYQSIDERLAALAERGDSVLG